MCTPAYVLQFLLNLISRYLLLPFYHIFFICLELANKVPERSPPPLSFSTCWSIPKDSLRPIYQLLYPPASPLGKVLADSSPGVLPCLPTPSQFPHPTSPPYENSGQAHFWAKSKNSEIPYQVAAAPGRRAAGWKQTISHQEIPTGLSKAQDLWECFPGCPLVTLFFPTPSNEHFKKCFSPKGKKITLEFLLPVWLVIGKKQ